MSEVERKEIMSIVSFYRIQWMKGQNLTSGWGIFLSMGIQAICGKERVDNILQQLVDERILRRVGGDCFFR